MVGGYLYLVSQLAIDLAEAVVAFKDLRKPTTLSKSFYILNEERIISDSLAEKMAKIAGFRNIILIITKVNYDIVYGASG